MIKRTTIVVILMLVFYPYECSIHKFAEGKDEETREIVNIDEVVPDIVTVTTYSITEGETDSTPLITASGFKINPNNPKRHRIIAVSRDLKRKYKFGTKLRIKGAGKYDGTYTVRDVMNKRYTKRIDILVGKSDKQTKLKKVKVYKLK